MNALPVFQLFGLKPVKGFIIKPAPPAQGSNPDLLMGLELEIEGCREEGDWYVDNVIRAGFRVETDDSLRGQNIRRGGVRNEVPGNAYEFITHPMTQSTMHHAINEFFRICGFTDERNYSDRTSIHVHVNCQDKTIDQVSSLALLYTVVERILFQFVGNNRDNNIYCIPWEGCRLNHDIVDRIASDPVTSLKRWQKYTALNLCPLVTYGTVEFRHMYGTADTDKLHAWLNIIGSIVGYSSRVTLEEMIAEIKSLNSTSEYDVFFNRVFQGTLTYNDAYRQALEAGIITAKIGLINWKRTEKLDVLGRKRAAVTKPAESFDELLQAVNAHQAARNPNRLDVWPITGMQFFVRNGELNTAFGPRDLNLLQEWSMSWVREGSIVRILDQAPVLGGVRQAARPNIVRDAEAEPLQAVNPYAEVPPPRMPPPAPTARRTATFRPAPAPR